MERKVNSHPAIGTTRNYAIFKPLRGNRPLDEVLIKRLMESFKQCYLPFLIIVNEFFEIIDGQHREEAAKRLGLPVSYEIRPGYGLKEAQILNQNGKEWNKRNFLNSYCEIGHIAYIQMHEFMDAFPDFGIASAEVILTNNVGGCNNKASLRDNGKEIGRVRNFQNGDLIITDIARAYQNARKIMEYKKYFPFFHRVAFVNTMISLFKNPNFNHELMIKKLELQPTALEPCSNMEQYKKLIEKIYNYRSRNKVSLIY